MVLRERLQVMWNGLVDEESIDQGVDLRDAVVLEERLGISLALACQHRDVEAEQVVVDEHLPRDEDVEEGRELLKREVLASAVTEWKVEGRTTLVAGDRDAAQA